MITVFIVIVDMIVVWIIIIAIWSSVVSFGRDIVIVIDEYNVVGIV